MPAERIINQVVLLDGIIYETNSAKIKPDLLLETIAKRIGFFRALEEWQSPNP